MRRPTSVGSQEPSWILSGDEAALVAGGAVLHGGKSCSRECVGRWMGGWVSGEWRVFRFVVVVGLRMVLRNYAQ